jgi:TnpA family transposase
MPRLPFLSPEEHAAFDTPPVFTNAERQRFFAISHSLDTLLRSFRTPTNQSCFVLALGYFKATQRFFVRQFHEPDAAYVARQLGCFPEVFVLQTYDDATARRHRKLILDHLGFQPFDDTTKQVLVHESRPLVRSQARPQGILCHMRDILARRKTEIPSARTLTDLITEEIRRHQGTLSDVLSAQMPSELRALLDALLAKPMIDVEEAPQVQRFKLTLLKTISQSTRPTKIRATLDDWRTLRGLHDPFLPVLTALDLTPEGLRYYANAVLKTRIFQVARRGEDDRHLHLVCFIAHQFYRVQDTLIDVLLTVVHTALSAGKRHHKDQYYAARLEQRRAVQAFVECVDHGAISPLNAIEAIAFSGDLSDPEKVQRIQAVLTDRSPQRQTAQAHLHALQTQAQREAGDADYYAVLVAQSRKLQNRVADLVKVLAFQGDAQSPLLVALQHYQAKEGQVTQTAPVEFLDPQEQQAVFDETGAIRGSLYKALLFIKITEALKGGVLNVRHSYKYRSLDDYLIAKADWEGQREAYLQRAELTGVADWPSTLQTLAVGLDAQYRQTNQRILAEANPHVHFRKDGSFHVSTPAADPEDSEPLLSVLPQRRYISLLEVLATVNRCTHFLEAFTPWRVTYARAKPPERTFFAGITGYGCFIGTQKIASISSGIAESELESTVNGYFTLDNIHGANDRIVQFMDHLALPEIYRQPGEPLHTSSDGQKFAVAVDSLHASYSFKYFGQDQGVSAYTFIDMRHFLPYSVIISAAEHEAHYVIDGLMHNDVVQSDIHSTDTGGYSEILFGAMHLLGFAFAPRIKNFAKCTLYALHPRREYAQQGYKILPAAAIKTDDIALQWDEVLRFIATIKLKEATASQLFKRLNSYSRQHPLYHALKEFGKIPKSDFLLRYIDTVTLRQAVEQQLNKGENANKFSRAVAFGNHQEFLSGEKIEQEIAEGCRRLIKNAIICWNYLYLTKKLAEADNEDRRQALLIAVRHGSVVTWQHINLQGEYDFSDEKLQDSIGLLVPELWTVKGF